MPTRRQSKGHGKRQQVNWFPQNALYVELVQSNIPF